MDDQLFNVAQCKYLCSDGLIYTWDELIDGLDADLIPKCQHDFALFLSCVEARPIVFIDVASCTKEKHF